MDKNEQFVKFLMTLVVLMDFMGMAIVVVIFPDLFLGENTLLFSSNWSHGDKLIALGACLAIYPLGQFFGSSIFGKLSDFHGRRVVLGWTLLGTLGGYIISAIGIELGSYSLLFISRLITGLFAGNVAVAQATLVDISTEETKTKNLSLSQMAMGSAYVIGPVFGAILTDTNVINWFGPSVPFLFFAGILCLELCLVVFCYKNTNSKKIAVAINLFDGMQQIYRALTARKIRSAFSVWFFFVAGWWLFESFMPSFLLERFNFSTSTIGLLLAFNGALYAIFQYAVVQRIANKINPIRMVVFFTPLTGLAIISMAYVTNTHQLYMAMIVFVLAMGFCIPGLITSISNMAEDNEQGQMMGMIGSVQALATVLVMFAGGYIHALNINSTTIGGGCLIIISWLIFTAISMNGAVGRKHSVSLVEGIQK